MTKTILRGGVAFAILIQACVSVYGYVISQYKWSVSDVVYYINPTNRWLDAAITIQALTTAADVWNAQTNASVRLVYGGTTTGATLGPNGKSEVFFQAGAPIAPGAGAFGTFWPDATGRIIDGDIVFYEDVYAFFAHSGCSQGLYLESVAVHEFGHMLGIYHSDVAGAVMQPWMPGLCDRSYLTLTPDDIAALEALYPPVTNQPPPPQPPTATLLVATYKVKGLQHVNLRWSALNATAVEIYRDGAVVASALNTGAYTDALNRRGGGAYTYRVCSSGSQTCTSTARAVF